MPMHPNVLFLAEVLLSDEGFFLIGCYAGCIAKDKNAKNFFIFIFLLLKACGSGSSGKRQVTTAEPGTLVIN